MLLTYCNLETYASTQTPGKREARLLLGRALGLVLGLDSRDQLLAHGRGQRAQAPQERRQQTLQRCLQQCIPSTGAQLLTMSHERGPPVTAAAGLPAMHAVHTNK